jgi:prephenate dehydrogenase
MEPLRAAIVGYGLIGGSIDLALGRLEHPPVIQALDAGDDLARASGADLIILAAPISANIRILGELGRTLTHDALITDTGSTKEATVAAAEALPANLQFIGGHPIAGAAAGGRAAARADLFDGKPWILTPDRRTRPQQLETLRLFVQSVGAAPRVMDAGEHDRLLAFISHLPQLTISALMHVAGNAAGERGLALAGPGLRDSTRLAASSAALWHDIIATNRANVNAALDDLIGALQRLRDQRDADGLAQVFADAASWKERLDAS